MAVLDPVDNTRNANAREALSFSSLEYLERHKLRTKVIKEDNTRFLDLEKIAKLTKLR